MILSFRSVICFLALMTFIPSLFSGEVTKRQGWGQDNRQIHLRIICPSNRLCSAEIEYLIKAPYTVVWDTVRDLDHMNAFMEGFLYSRTVGQDHAKTIVDSKQGPSKKCVA